MGKLLDLVYAGARYGEMLGTAAVAFAYIFLSSCAESILHRRYNRKLEYAAEQQSCFLDRKCQSMDYEYLEEKRVHDMISQINRGTGSPFGVLGELLSTLETLIRTSVSVIAAVVIVIPLFAGATSVREGFMTSWLVSILLFGVISALVFLNYKMDVGYGKKIRECRRKAAKDDNILNYYMGILASYDRQKDLRIFRQRSMIEQAAAEKAAIIEDYDKRETKIGVKSAFVKNTVSAVSGFLVYLFAGFKAYLGLISVGSVVTYASSIMKMTDSMSMMMLRLARLKNLSSYINDYAEFMDLGKRKYEGAIPMEKRRDNRFQVEFDHVSFKYPGVEDYAIRDLSIKFTIGEKMAIVGKNGSGKTTFIKLLCRLYDVTEGCIKVNGVDIRKYNYEEYCRLFAVVFQDFRMFAFPLGENISSGDEVEEQRALDALNRSGLGERMRNLPQGLDTCVGKEFSEEGVTFSGGEKQKMAIARAIYKDAPFVIMDEPTAALDPVAECEVFAGFDRMVGRKTAIYISHRLASCRFCQDILVFDRGRIVQRGTHEELEKQEGLYQQLWNAQAKYYT